MKGALFLRETDIAKSSIDYLTDLQWDIYQEVQPYSGSACADIVAIQGPIAWVVECKVNAGLRVIEQAYRWKGWANMVSIAVPNASPIVRRVCEMLGVGVLQRQHYDATMFEAVRPQVVRKTSRRLREALRPAHKTYCAAGTSGGGQWTPFKDTCRNVLRTARRHPDGISIKKLVEKTTTHYSSTSSARQCLRRWIAQGIVPGVEMRRDGRRIYIYPTEREENNGHE
jgi:hypothetical protein